MPAPLTTSQDRRSHEGLVYRTCTRCNTELPLTPENFQHRNNWIDARCDNCRREVDAANRAARRQGEGVRAGRRFGVEIEFIGDGYAVERAMRDLGLVCNVEHYNHQVRAGWKIVPDASVSRGMELVSPPLRGANGREQVKKACRALAAAGATINGSCGLHVHHDCNDLTGAQLAKLGRAWARNQRSTDNLVARSRRGAYSQWCRPLSESEVQRLESLPATAVREGLQRAVQSTYIDRYRSINFSCFPRYGTVEIRQHQGTLNAKKILAWVAYGQAFIRAAKSSAPIPTPANTLGLIDALTAHGLGAPMAAYLKARAAMFNTTLRTAVAA